MAVGAVCRHDASQEPGAVVPHAGICGGGGQQWLSLLRLKPLRCAAASQIKKQARMLAQYQMKKRAQSQIKKQAHACSQRFLNFHLQFAAMRRPRVCGTLPM